MLMYIIVCNDLFYNYCVYEQIKIMGVTVYLQICIHVVQIRNIESRLLMGVCFPP